MTETTADMDATTRAALAWPAFRPGVADEAGAALKRTRPLSAADAGAASRAGRCPDLLRYLAIAQLVLDELELKIVQLEDAIARRPRTTNIHAKALLDPGAPGVTEVRVDPELARLVDALSLATGAAQVGRTTIAGLGAELALELVAGLKGEGRR